MTDEENQKQFEIKDNYTVEGITGDYVWYNYKKLSRQMKTWHFEFEKVVSVMESRHREHLTMIEDLMRENKTLKILLKQEQSK